MHRRGNRRQERGAQGLGVGRVGSHFHNTRNLGLANALSALEAGALALDASVGGSGGCPFAPRATGNIPTEDLVRVVEEVHRAGLKAKPEVGIQFGAGGATAAAELEAEGTRDPSWAIMQARRYLDAGAELIMIESEGITECVRTWRTDAVARLVEAFGPERLMFEAADPAVFTWYVKTYGPEVNLFVDHSQVVQLECLRAGIWGTKDLWGRVVTYKP